jgi:hypothetical protein
LMSVQLVYLVSKSKLIIRKVTKVITYSILVNLNILKNWLWLVLWRNISLDLWRTLNLILLFLITFKLKKFRIRHWFRILLRRYYFFLFEYNFSHI